MQGSWWRSCCEVAVQRATGSMKSRWDEGAVGFDSDCDNEKFAVASAAMPLWLVVKSP